MPPSAPPPLHEATSTLRTWLEVDAAAVRANAATARALAGPAGGVLAVLKADAYGIGVSTIVPALVGAAVDGIAVATLAEAVEVHGLGSIAPVYLLSPALPAERAAVVAADFTVIPAISSSAEAVDFNALALAAGKRLPVHLVLDTGMGRIGFPTTDVAAVVVEVAAVAALPGLLIDSVASHFPSADEDVDFTTDQQARYTRVLTMLAEVGMAVDHHHLANSAGTLAMPRAGTGREWVRTGLMLYGVSPVPDHQNRLRETVTWHARVVLARTLPAGHGISYGRTFVTQRPTQVATLAVGYADGYPRHLSGQGAWVWLGGQPCPVLGRVTMDQIMVEAPAGVRPGDVATLLGGRGPSPMELAGRAGTIPYEIFCGIGRRVARVLVGNSDPPAP